MVFESLVVELLNTFLGDYVENLDSSQLKLGIWGGDVSLTNLFVKESALDEFDLPIKVVSGHLGHLKLNIPWKKLYTAPVVATIDSLFVIAVPNVGIVYNEEKEQKSLAEAKQKKLKKIEDAKIKEENKKKNVKKKDAFTEKLVTQIIKNLQVKISHIHIRYEDVFTSPKHPFSVGVTLNNLSFETTDEHWVPCVLQETVKMIHKLVSLDSLAVYWNSSGPIFSSLAANEQTELMLKTIAESGKPLENMSYVFGPVTSVAKLKLNPKPETDGSNYTIPRLWLNLDFHEISISITKSQYKGIMLLLDSMDRMAVAANFRKYRPNVPLEGNAKAWWKFCMTCVLEEDVRRKHRNWSWKNMHNHRTMCKMYKLLYKDSLLGKKIVKKELEMYEANLDVFNIIVARKQAEIEVTNYDKKDMRPKKGWISSWLGWGNAPDNTTTGGIDLVKQFEEAMDAKEKLKLYEAIGYQENMIPTEYPPEFVENHLVFGLRSLILKIVDDSSKNSQVLKTELQDVTAEFEQRPSADALKFVSSIGGFTVYGRPVESGSARVPKMVTSLTASSSVPLLLITFETYPLDKSCDQRIHVSSRSLQITYDAPTMNRFVEVLKPPEEIVLQQLQAAAFMKLEDIKELSSFGLQYVIEKRKIVDLSIDLKPSYIVIPEFGVSYRKGNQLVLNLGNFQMHSLQTANLPSVKSLVKAGSTEDEVLTTMISHAYDKFEIKIQNVAILLVSTDRMWEDIHHQEDSPFHLLQPLQLSIVLEKAILQDDPRLPKLKITGELPSVKLGLSDEKLLQVLKLVTSIPLPEPEPVPSSGVYVPLTNLTSSATESAQVNSRALRQITKGDALSGEYFEDVKKVQMTDLQLYFEIKEIALELSQVMNGKEQELVRVNVHQLGSTVAMRTFDMTVDLFLGGVTFQYLEFNNFDGSPLYIVQTPMTSGSTEKLFTIQYISVNKKAPNFATDYKSTLQFIKIKFTSLDVALHQEAILSLLNFTNQFTASLEQATRTSHLTVIDSDRIRRALSKPDVSRTKKVEELVDLQFNVIVDSIGITISNVNASICVAYLKGIEAGITMMRTGMLIKSVLKDLLILDPTPNAVYPKILSTVYGDVVSVDVQMYQDATEGIGYVDMSVVDMKILVSLGRMKIVFLNKYISALLAFLDQFQMAKAKMSEASIAAAQVARQGVEAAYDQASRVALDIYLQAPVIIMPKNCHSRDVLIADLGTLSLKNAFQMGSKRNELGMPCIFDHITLGLQNIKISRAILDPVSSSVVAECLMLEPISFVLNIVRNLTISWYKDEPEINISGQLAAVYMSASQEDYALSMGILSENLAESVQTTVSADTSGLATTSSTSTAEAVITETTLDSYGIELRSQTYKRMKFNIILESFSASLYDGSSNLRTGLVKRDVKRSITRVELKTVAITGEMLSDSSMWANVILVNFILDDTRAKRKAGVTRLMESTSTAESQSMIDVTYRQEANQNTFVDVKVHSFSFVVCLDYLLTLKDFFVSEETTVATSSAVSNKPDVQQVKVKHSSQVMTIQVHLEEPDLVLIENIEDIDSNAIIFHNEITLKMKMTSESQSLSGVVSNLELFTASYNPKNRDSTMQKILDRCDINLFYSSHINENQHVDIRFTDIIIHINPYTVQTLTNILSALSSNSQTGYSSNTFLTAKEQDILWEPKQVSILGLWYLNAWRAKEALEDQTLQMKPEEPIVVTQTEQLMLQMETIMITVEAGIGKSVIPLIMLESSFTAEVINWSTNLQVKNTRMAIEIAYFNETVARWEPLLEPVNKGGGKDTAWQLEIDVTKNTNIALEGDSPSEENIIPPPVMSIVVSSSEPLEITLTRTSLEMMSKLAQAFQTAVNDGSNNVLKAEAPYIVENFLGIPVTIIISGTTFQVMNSSEEMVEDIVLEPGTRVGLTLKDTKRLRSLNYMRTADALEDLFFSLKLEVDGVQAVRTIYVMRVEKHFYQLPVKTYPGDQWAFVVNILSDGGSKIISLQSVVQVCNHLQMPLEIFYMQPGQNEQLESCGIVEPDRTMFVPTYALYTHKNELFLKPQDKTISTQPVIWKDLFKNPNVNQTFECGDKESGDSLQLQLYGEMEQVFHEYSKKKTLLSTRYQLHIGPPVILRNLLPFPMQCCVVAAGSNEMLALPEGGSAHLITARMGKSEVLVEINNYLGRDWTCMRKLSTDIPELSVWSFESESKHVMDLGVRTENVFGSWTMSIYCPFWMVNKTGLTLTYRGDEPNVLQHPADTDHPILFSFRAKSFFAKKKACLKVEDSEWSDKFAIDVIGSSGNVIAKAKSGRTYVLGVQIKLSKCRLTKIVVFTPFNLLVNNSLKPIECKEDVKDAEWVTVPTSMCVPFWPIDPKKSEMIVRYADSSEETMPFSYKDSTTTLLKLTEDDNVGIHVDCRVGELSVILNFQDYFPGSATVLFVNDSEHMIEYCQSGLLEKQQLQSHEAVLYTWEQPTGIREIVWSCGNVLNQKDALTTVDLKNYTLDDDTVLYYVNFLDGLQRVILFTHDVLLAGHAQQAGTLERADQEMILSLQSFGLSLVNNQTKTEVMYLGITSTGIIWESRKHRSNRFKSLTVKECAAIESSFQKYVNEMKIGKASTSFVKVDKMEIDFHQMVMLKPVKRVIRRTFVPGLWVQMKTSTHQSHFHAKVNRLQIDNQLQDYVFPVFFTPVPLPRSVVAENAPKPFAEVSLIRRVMMHSDVVEIQYLKALIQEFSLKVDLVFVNSLIHFFTPDEVAMKDYEDAIRQDKEVMNLGLTQMAAVYFSQEQKNWYDMIHLSPIKVHLSFSYTGGSVHSDIFNLLLKSVGVTLTEIQDVVFKLNYFEKTNVCLTRSQFISEAVSHYSSQAIKQLYVLVLGLDVIGNPVGLFLGLKSGVGDLFYEPFQGAIQGPEEFAEGLALGLRSLFGHTLGGAAGAVSRITGTLGKGLAALTMDDEYQRKRRQAMSRRTGNFGENLAQGGKGVVMGVVEGVTGVVTKPVEGARQQGFEGFVKGIGKGLIGVVARPTTGIIDFASGSLDAVKRVADMSAEIKRLRLPRYIPPDGIVRPYSVQKAEGNNLLLDVDKGKYASTDTYVAHASIAPDKKSYLLVTSQRLIYIEKGDVFGQWESDWQYTWDEIKEFEIIPNKGIKILLKEQRKKKFGGTENGKLVTVKDPELSKWIVTKMEETIRYNLQQNISVTAPNGTGP